MSFLLPFLALPTVSVREPKIQKRIAKAQGKILLDPNTINLIKENQIKKGDVLTVANLAGIMTAKQAGLIIPLCHPITIDNAKLTFSILEDGIIAESEVTCTGRIGVEMEAIVSVSIALVTIFDMCKAVDKNMKIGDIVLTDKIKIDKE